MASTRIKPSQKCNSIHNWILLNIKTFTKITTSNAKAFRKVLVRHKAFFESIAALATLFVYLNSQFGFSLAVDGLNINVPIELGKGEFQNLNLIISGGMVLDILAATPIGKICLDAEVPAGLNISVRPNIGCPPFHSNILIHVDDNSTEGLKRIVFRGNGEYAQYRERT